MSSIILPGSAGSINNIDLTQTQFRGQVGVVAESIRQLAGNPDIAQGAFLSDALNAPYVLYVNPYIGKDTFVGGSYSTLGSATERIELQRLECGYTSSRPFRTINRAVIEAGIITAKSYYQKPLGNNDLVSIVLAPGAGSVLNGAGAASVSEWASGKQPTDAELQAFNPETVGGILLPRGMSVCGMDLRKTIVRPDVVPSPADEASDYSNRRAIFKLTGLGYFFGFTFMDKVGSTTSHHLLDCFQFASRAELDAFYTKIRSAFAGANNTGGLDPALAVTNAPEYEIVGPIDITETPTSSWDTTASASPYIFNCSIRSDYGLCGAFMDGSKVNGLKSMVCANFTGVSLQKDMSSWQRYDGTDWVQPTYAQYISSSPNSIRMNPARLSRHIAAINDAFIQEVSVFAIGHGIHHFTDLGGEITITNSNSSFGGCAALSRGYKQYSFPQDEAWVVGKIRVPLNVSEKTGNVSRIFLGVVSAVSSSAITLSIALTPDEIDASVPSVLAASNYTLAASTKIWVENPLGDDWRTDLATTAWSNGTPAQINIQSALTQAGTNDPVGTNPETSASLAIGRRVYVRRLVDTRTPNQRRLSLLLNNTTSARTPEKNFVLQTDPGRAGGSIGRELQAGGSEVLVISNSGVGGVPGAGVTKTAEISIRRGAPTITYANSTYYRTGTVVRYQNKHYRSLKDQTTNSSVPDSISWGETFVHMPSAYNAEDTLTNEGPILVFDTDTDASADTATCGINFSTIWTAAGSVRNQYRSATDYLGAHALLLALGFSDTAAHNALVPQVTSSRERDPASSTDFPVAPSGGAATGRGNWAIEFRRPSVLRLYGHAWEWAGFLNYSKSIPAAQQDLSPQNKFSYYFTHEGGGRVVPQGSNEDGFNITPRGLEDIETGATVSVDSIGISKIDEVQTTDFPSGLTAASIQVDELTISNSVIFPEGSIATTEILGPVTFAKIADIDTETTPATTDAQIDAAGDKVITLPALNRWLEVQDLAAPRADGTEAAPSYNFTNDINTGLYRYGSETLGFTTNGTVKVIVDDTANPLKEKVGGVFYPVVAQNDIGTGANQLTLNQYLGTLAYQNATAPSVGGILANGLTGIGYAVGAGLAVTQATSRTTGVTINAPSGSITLFSAAGSTAFQTFTVTNSAVAATDVIKVTQKSGTDSYAIWVTAVAAGSFAITFATLSGTTTEAPVFNFVVIKAVNS